jgi:proteasome lid subunit RPN8/RPN11
MNLLREVYNEIVDQATRELPDESCGYLLGIGDDIVENYRMTNADHSPEHFSFIPKEQFEAVKYARKKGLKVIANWHSHPSSPSRPSDEDIRLAYDPSIDYFILSLAADEPVLNRFHIVNGKVEKLPFQITNQSN